MPPVYNHWLVILSIVVAMLVSFTALRLAARVATSERQGARIWLGIGSLAMGVGIWSMHFIGMLAFSLPIPLAYSIPTTLISLAVAIVTSGFALSITSGRRLTVPRLSGSAVIMGSGIAAMHYTGMAAITVIPGISYDPLLVALSVLIAVAASYVALWLFFRLREGNSSLQWFTRIAAAVVMGLAISGMHYTGMAAARFAAGSFCLGGATFQNNWLAGTIGLFALGLLILTLVTSLYDAHLQSSARTHAQRLEQANVELQHQATHDALTGLPNRVLF
jgi:diguanylate cyclase